MIAASTRSSSVDGIVNIQQATEKKKHPIADVPDIAVEEASISSKNERLTQEPSPPLNDGMDTDGFTPVLGWTSGPDLADYFNPAAALGNIADKYTAQSQRND